MENKKLELIVFEASSIVLVFAFLLENKFVASRKCIKFTVSLY